MKKLSILSLAFLGIVSMTSCSNSGVYSLKEASGFDLSNISSVQVSESVYQSFTWNLIDDAYQYLDCDYIKVDFDINKEFLSSWPSSELKDNANVLHVNIKDIELYKDYGITFFISHNTNYMYFDGIEATYRSSDKVPSKFIELINDKSTYNN